MEDFLKQTFYDPSHPAGFSSVNKLWRAAKQAGYHEASYDKVKKWLLSQETYATSVQSRRTVHRTPVRVAGFNAQFDIDLADLNQYGSENDGWKYVLAVLDIFSRFLITRKLKSKSPVEVAKALDDIFTHVRRPLYLVRTDAGMELQGRAVKAVYAKFNLTHIVTRNEAKANYVERVLKTWKGKLFKYFISKQTHRWVDVCDEITEAYNNSVHSSLGDKPVNITARNEGQSRIQQYKIKHSLDDYGHSKKVVASPKKSPPSSSSVKKTTKPSVKPKPKYAKGQLVRVSRLRHAFSREYSQKWSHELFKVHNIIPRDDSIYAYTLEDLLGEVLKGTFYREEITAALEPEGGVYMIDRILTKRGRGKNLQYRVSWLGWPAKFSSWISASEVTNIPSRTPPR